MFKAPPCLYRWPWRNEPNGQANILLTSNRAPAEWPDVFWDPLLASAGLDRLLDRAESLSCEAPSIG
ncbi:MAG: hypothetical protein CO094_06600 [Anaerolineae bacterium CG_4_9_14_3_um_filter_57_17]|nr:ATP-binding protein [bacterium]NCT21553.1 ATP-binding protein [bacterium]PJB66726.1 MAG: hypothetical protein CO094_06600 [Anaerolineae bacterium CG_4_9_14_3_um_filter_57_17]